MNRSIRILSILLFFSSAGKCQKLYIKPQFNFDFSLPNTIRQDILPFAKVENHHRQAIITMGLRAEYIKSNGNGYFFNFTILPLGFATKYTDYAFIDPFYQQQATTSLYTAIHTKSASSDIWAFDIGFINKLAILNLSKRKQLDIKFGYGGTFASFRPYSQNGYFISTNINSMNKNWEVRVSDYPYFNPDKGKLGVMIPLKLNFNIKSKIRDVELLSLDFGYWHGLTRGAKYNLAYHNLTDNVIYDNVVESKGTTWQIGVQVPIRIKLKK